MSIIIDTSLLLDNFQYISTIDWKYHTVCHIDAVSTNPSYCVTHTRIHYTRDTMYTSDICCTFVIHIIVSTQQSILYTLYTQSLLLSSSSDIIEIQLDKRVSKCN